MAFDAHGVGAFLHSAVGMQKPNSVLTEEGLKMARLAPHAIRRSALLLISLITALAVVPCGWAQTTLGAVSGTVRDLTGGVIPNASVTLTNTATNVVANANTNEVGFYIFPAVVPGAYTLSAQSPGMQKFEGAFT